MPIYEYRNPETDETIEIIQSMNDEHKYFDKAGLEWKRVWTSPNVSIDSSADIDPNSKKDFLTKTSNKSGSVGDMMDISAELSEKRAEKNGGIDPLKDKKFKDYEKENKVKHLLDKPKSISKGGISVEL